MRPPTQPTLPTRPHGRRAAVAAALVAAVVAVLAVSAGPAGAHVTSQNEPAASGGRTPVTFSFDHGCNGQPTTYLRVQIPDGVTDVVPENPAGWTSTANGGELRWEGGSVPNGQVASFTATMTISAPEGTVVRFPTIQGCPTAQSAWIQIPDAANPDPAYPAPSITVGAAGAATLAAEPPTTSTTAPTTTSSTVTRQPLEATPVTKTGSEENSVGVWVFAGVVLIIAGGALILYLRHRRPRSS